MKLVLIRPNYKSHIITPPLGIGYLASYLKKEGIEVRIIDGLRDRLNNEQILKKTLKENPDAVGISCLTAFYSEVTKLSKLIKANNIRCIIGGVHPTFLPYSTLLDTGADFAICGEGELALSKLIKNNFNNRGIKGVYALEDLKSDDGPFEKAEIVQNLDEIPFPDWQQISPNSYPKAPHGAIVKNFPIGVVMTTRGCPYECVFCASPGFYDRKIRSRSAQNVIKELKYLVEDFGVKEIHFEDDNLTLNKDNLKQVCNLIIQNKLKISWACPNGIRADEVDADLIRLMVKSGCYYFAYGIESASPSILRNIKKHTAIDTIERSIRIANEAGISCQGFFIFGLPGETAETIEETINFARSSKLSRAQFLILDVIPGSELWRTLKGKFKPNWGKDSYKEPEWVPEGLSDKQLMQAQTKGFLSFYLRLSVIFNLLRTVRFGQISFLMQRLKDYRIIKSYFLKNIKKIPSINGRGYN